MSARASFVFAASLLAPTVAHADSQTEVVFAAIITIEPGDGEYAGYYCPPPESEDEICLGASILIQRGTIDRFLGNHPVSTDPRMKKAWRSDVDGSYYRMKLIGRHAMRRFPAGRYLAILEPTDDDHIFVQWKYSFGDSKGCFPKYTVDHYASRISFDRLKLREDGRRCL